MYAVSIRKNMIPWRLTRGARQVQWNIPMISNDVPMGVPPNLTICICIHVNIPQELTWLSIIDISNVRFIYPNILSLEVIYHVLYGQTVFLCQFICQYKMRLFTLYVVSYYDSNCIGRTGLNSLLTLFTTECVPLCHRMEPILQAGVHQLQYIITFHWLYSFP